METRRRSIAKAITYRVGGLAVTMAVVWAVTGMVSVAASVGVLDSIVKLAAFYLHERAWSRVRFGKES